MLRLFAVIPVVLAVSLAGADGLMLPAEPDYPHDFLRNRMTHVEVEMHGVVAVTSVYQEFVNEWHRETDAVYSFPLPPDARATEVLYWRDGKVLEAVLRVRDQAVNPGTGEGGARCSSQPLSRSQRDSHRDRRDRAARDSARATDLHQPLRLQAR